MHSDRFTDTAGQLSPLTLAFIGDGVFELLSRQYILGQNPNLPVNKLHRLTVALVEAKAQSRAYGCLEPLLDERELAVMKRGRNANSVAAPRRADVADYRRATGVETLFGYLYLRGKHERIDELFGALVGGEESGHDSETEGHEPCK